MPSTLVLERPIPGHFQKLNHLGDADSVGSIAGQLAGAIYGFGDIDRRLKEQLWCWDDGEVATRGAMLYGARALLKDP